MSVTVRIPPTFRGTTEGHSVVTVEGSNLAQVFDALESGYPGLRGRILDGAGQIHRHINVFINDDDARFLDGLASEVPADAEIALMPAVAGGSASCQC